MITKGVLKDAAGNPMKKEDFRIVFKSDFLPRAPTPPWPRCRTI